MSKYLDENGLLYYDGKIKSRLNTKVDKETGKGLSSNDYTTEEKNKLASLENYVLPKASTETLGGIKVGVGLAMNDDGTLNATGSEITIDDKMSTTSGNPVQNKVITTELNKKVDAESGKGLSTNDYTTPEKTKLAGIAAGAEVNQNAFSTISDGTNNINASSKTATLTVAKGDNVDITLSGTTMTISAKDTTYGEASSDTAGLLSAADKIKLDGIATGATKVIVDSTLSSTSSNPVQNKTIYSELGKKVTAIEGKGLSTNDYTNEEKTKLAGLENYVLPKASASALGGVIINGGNLAIDNTGKLSVTGMPVVDTTLSTTSNNAIANSAVTTELNKKVNAETGKGLSTNDYTTTEKNKLSNIAAGAQVNVIETVKVNGTALTPVNKAVDVTVPTNNNQLTNGANYQNATQVQSAIDNALKDITGIDFQIVTELPASGKKGVIYLLSSGGEDPDIYDEYIWVGDPGRFEKIGSTKVDLSGYWQNVDSTASNYLISLTNAEIDEIIKRSVAS